MNTHLKQLWAAMKLPKNFKKSYKFFCLGLDIRVTKVMEKAENPLHIYSEYWMQGCGGRCPYLNRKTLKKRNKRNIFYMKKKCGRISGYMFCFL